MTFNRITTAGAGTMGSQVAWQMALHGKHVTVYDAIPAGLGLLPLPASSIHPAGVHPGNDELIGRDALRPPVEI